ncbi:hypothetical protein HQ576_11525, partial [bacterium]|nr:hypothetical protein [bacterium]
MAVSRLRTLSLATALIAATVAHGRPFRVVAFGDSTTAFRKTIQKVYSVRLAEALKTQGIAAEVLNAGISGNTTAQAKARLVTDVLWRGPDLVVVQFGINDSAVDVWKGATKPRLALDAYEKNLRDILATLKQHGIAAVLMTPNPRRWAPHTKARYGKPPYQPDEPRGFNVALDQYVPVVRRLAKELGVPLVDVYRALEDYDAKDGQEMDTLMLDGIHPNDKGHAMVAELLGPPVVAAARRFASPAQHGPAAAPRRLVLV